MQSREVVFLIALSTGFSINVCECEGVCVFVCGCVYRSTNYNGDFLSLNVHNFFSLLIL